MIACKAIFYIVYGVERDGFLRMWDLSLPCCYPGYPPLMAATRDETRCETNYIARRIILRDEYQRRCRLKNTLGYWDLLSRANITPTSRQHHKHFKPNMRPSPFSPDFKTYFKGSLKLSPALRIHPLRACLLTSSFAFLRLRSNSHSFNCPYHMLPWIQLSKG